MRKDKAKQDGKMHRFFKYLTQSATNIFRITLLGIMLAVIAIEVVVVLYSIGMHSRQRRPTGLL